MGATGPTGNRGEGRYYADLATGSLGASAYAQNSTVPLYDYYGNFVGYDHPEASGEASVGMSDRLHFTIPKGTYTSDLTITLYGQATGAVTTTQYGTALGSLYAYLYGAYGGGGTAQWPATPSEGTAMGNQTIPVDMPFALSAVILPAGTYTTDMASYAVVHLSIGQQASLQASAPASPGEQNPAISTASANFLNGLRVTALQVPEGVTWTSDSGVFLSKMSVLHNLTVTIDGNGTIHTSPGTDMNCSGTCSQTYPTDAVVTLTPMPDPDHIFAGWSQCDAPSCPSCNMTMDADKSITATFWDKCQLFLHQMGLQP